MVEVPKGWEKPKEEVKTSFEVLRARALLLKDIIEKRAKSISASKGISMEEARKAAKREIGDAQAKHVRPIVVPYSVAKEKSEKAKEAKERRQGKRF
jgi:hypothetical protein